MGNDGKVCMGNDGEVFIGRYVYIGYEVIP